MKKQAVNERQGEADLRRRFRLAVPHIGLDPDYTLDIARFEAHEILAGENASSLPTARGEEMFRFEAQGMGRNREDASGMRRARGGAGGTEREGSGRGGGEGGTGERETRGEGYTEPSYMTRQRCLVLNDWALSLFGIGEHRKVT